MMWEITHLWFHILIKLCILQPVPASLNFKTEFGPAHAPARPTAPHWSTDPLKSLVIKNLNGIKNTSILMSQCPAVPGPAFWSCTPWPVSGNIHWLRSRWIYCRTPTFIMSLLNEIYLLWKEEKNLKKVTTVNFRYPLMKRHKGFSS